jgi:hypothetical protein
MKNQDFAHYTQSRIQEQLAIIDDCIKKARRLCEKAESLHNTLVNRLDFQAVREEG